VRRVVPRAAHALGFLGDEEPAGLEKGGVKEASAHLRDGSCQGRLLPSFLSEGRKAGKAAPPERLGKGHEPMVTEGSSYDSRAVVNHRTS
jgi:hypothetical protein